MFKSLLNAAGAVTESLILDIFIIIAVVVAGALVIYFLWEAVNAAVAKPEKKTTAAPRAKVKQKVNDEQLVVVKIDEPEETEVKEPEITELNQQTAEQEKNQAEAEIEEQERVNEERRAYLEARRQELIRRMQAEMQEENQQDSEEQSGEQANEEADKPETVEVQETEQTAAETESEVEKVETPEQPAAESEELLEERRALAVEKARYATMLQELEEAKRALAEQNEQAKTPVTVVQSTSHLSLDELRQRLADAEQRLASTEKEFKQCKKEYIPLRKIWVAHERDEKKLRRKEALVARQKVLLYGVNNFADIDEEKAKKLSEDLDHLDGLKLSVQHCEEVMAENAERYPLLEKMYGVLSQRNEELKNDIETYKKEIARLEAEGEEE